MLMLAKHFFTCSQPLTQLKWLAQRQSQAEMSHYPPSLFWKCSISAYDAVLLFTEIDSDLDPCNCTADRPVLGCLLIGGIIRYEGDGGTSDFISPLLGNRIK